MSAATLQVRKQLTTNSGDTDEGKRLSDIVRPRI